MADGVPEVFSDTFEFTFTAYGLAIAFGARPVRQPSDGAAAEPGDRAVVRMSLEQAKVLAMLLRRELNRYEVAAGIEIALPPEVYQSLELDPRDWPLPARG
ncbi:MAG: hypothetical protein WHT63_10640 [Tepidiforma sp.]